MAQQLHPHVLFPVRMDTTWCAEKSSHVNDYLRSWLLDPSSLTARLKSHCQTFRVEVLGQSIDVCSSEESQGDIVAGEKVLIREVLLFCDEKPQVFARSLLPLSSLTGSEKKLATLGNQSLGQVIFNHPLLQRKHIEVSSFDEHSAVVKLATHYQLKYTQPLWGRRSVFVVGDKPLMVAEIFLPNAYAYQPECT